MKNYSKHFLRCAAVAVALLATALSVQAKNIKTTVTQVATNVTLSDDVDYIVTSSTPFAEDGVVNIQNTDHAVLILADVKPSKANALLATHVQVEGARAVNGQNCQVKLYNRGCIILPYGDNTKPLTVFSEQNFEGEQCNDFGLENSGGYMNTLSDAKLNNRIRSFKLKRGYMVTFSLRSSGQGYSRCFIAADDDLEVATLPGILDRAISSYRVFKWYDAGKPQLANSAGSPDALAALHVQSTYDWGQGNSSLAPDIEWVPNHIYEDWPSSATIGSTTQSPHTKNNNEPRNSADDHPQDLNTILNNWENMMRTGLRLCSPASWDGSDYWNATGFLADFLDSIDARGWRCDIIDLHCYWPEGNFSNTSYWANKYGRPIWISEWCWGASWNNNGAFASGVTETQVRDALQRICTNLNSWSHIERYYYWNNERDPSRLYKNGKLTPAGEMYSKLDGGVGYNGKYEKIPNVPKQYDPSDLVVDFDKDTNAATLTWHDYNGEMNVGIYVQRRTTAFGDWQTIEDIAMKEQGADYTYTDTEAANGYRYRIYVIDANGKERYTTVVMAASTDLQAGDAITVGESTKYMGGNMFVNGSFEMGTYLWTNGEGNPLEQPWFQVLPEGGNDGGSYLQCYGNGGRNTVSAIKYHLNLKPNTDYYFSGAICNYGSPCSLFLTNDGTSFPTTPRPSLSNSTNNWLTQFETFNSGEYEQAIFWPRSLAATAQLDQLMLCELFDTQQEALADGMEKARQKAAAFMQYNTKYQSLNDELAVLDELPSPTDVTAETLRQREDAISKAIQAYDNMPRLALLIEQATHLTTLHLYGEDELQQAIELAQQAQQADDVNDQYERLQQAIDAYMPLVVINNKITSPNFANANGWTTKCGTFTGGDQRLNSKDGVTFWNAWWSNLSASEGTAKTMEVRQEVKNLSHGLYALECKASTEHYCLSDQHGYITDGDKTEVTPQLTADYFDLPSMSNDQRWQTLVSAPVYVPEGGSVTIGFTGSKEGATDGAWLAYGNESNNKTDDLREGWWCATGFKLRFHPLYLRTVTPGEWNAACLPYAVHPSPGIHFYEIAGITSDFTMLGLEEVTEVAAGDPFIFTSDNAEAVFLEYGTATTKQNAHGAGGLRGYFKAGTSIPAENYYLTNGAWNKVEKSDRPKTTEFTAFMRPITDADPELMKVLYNWEGLTMPINGVSQEEIDLLMTSAITSPTVNTTTADGLYTIDGRRVSAPLPVKGIYISVENGQARKMIVK